MRFTIRVQMQAEKLGQPARRQSKTPYNTSQAFPQSKAITTKKTKKIRVLQQMSYQLAELRYPAIAVRGL